MVARALGPPSRPRRVEQGEDGGKMGKSRIKFSWKVYYPMFHDPQEDIRLRELIKQHFC